MSKTDNIKNFAAQRERIETKRTTLTNTNEECFISNEDPYPLCKGNGEEKCHDCCLYEDYEKYHSPY